MYRQKYNVIYIAFISVKQIAAVKILYFVYLYNFTVVYDMWLVNIENTW